MTSITRRAMLASATLASATLAATSRASRAQTTTSGPSGPVRIGVLTDEAGPYASSGGPGSIAAARMALADFGSTVLGQPIEIIHADTRNKPDVAAATAREWFDQGVDAITDLPVTPVALAVQQLARERQRTVMVTGAAVTEFTSKLCSPTSTHWADDTHAMTSGTCQVITKAGGKTWFFVTVDFAFGSALQTEATSVIEANGGKVVGSTKFAIGNTDFASQIVQAQSSGAQVLGLASVGGDQVNLIKQLAEFGLQGKTGQTLAGFLVYLSDVHALGLDVAQGFRFPSSFYWDQSDGSRAFGKRFFADQRAMPTQNQANIYAATSHFLKSMAKAGTRDPLAVNRAMRAEPLAYFGQDTSIRSDGRVLHDVTLWRVKAPSESKYPWDYLAPIGTIPAADAFLPIAPACTAA